MKGIYTRIYEWLHREKDQDRLEMIWSHRPGVCQQWRIKPRSRP